MQVEIDFDVYKALTNELKDEADSYNEVIRRLLKLPASLVMTERGEIDTPGQPAIANPLSNQISGIWFSNVFFPNSTIFRATYKGATYRASVSNSQWVDQYGKIRTSPSDAANAISKSNVNGWKFWFAKRPEDEDWSRLDAFKP